MRPAFCAAALAAAAVTPRPAVAQRYTAATPETIRSTTEEREGSPAAHLIYVENRSTVPVTVFSVTLSQCENVRQSCFPRRVAIKVRPGRRELATRVEPRDPDRPFVYAFNLSWQADSGVTAAVAAMADVGNAQAQAQLAGYRRADSLAQADRMRGIRLRELTRDDFGVLAGRALRLRTIPDSVFLAPGEQFPIDHVTVVVADSAGAVLGRTRWLRWDSPANGRVARFAPPGRLVARDLGRTTMRFALAEEAQAAVGRPVDDIEVPVRVGYPADPHAPVFAGTAADLDRHGPLGCADVALEDSAQNVMARDRTDARGAYRLPAPRPGTYRVRVEANRWAPVYGPSEAAGRDTTVTREIPVRFTEQLLTNGYAGPWGEPEEFEHATVAALTTGAVARGPGAPVGSPVALGGTPSVPVLGIATRGPAAATWMQFVVDSAGRAELATLSFAPGTTAAQAAAARAVLPRVRFAPARAAGRPTCELVRMEARFGAP